MLKDIKLIVFDIDGTILNSTHQLDSYTLNILSRLQARGILVTLATGKTLPAVQALARQLNIEIPLIMSNGCILQYASGEFMHCSVFAENDAWNVLHEMEKCPADISIFSSEEIYVKEITPSVRAMMEFGGPYPTVITDWREIGDKFGQVVKFIGLNIHTPEKLKQYEKELLQVLGKKITISPSMYFMLEVLPHGVDKGSALIKLAEKLGIGMEQVIAIGDGDNDAAMLDCAGVGVAVANATLLCKAKAKVIIESNDKEGPARFLHGLVRELS